MLRENLDTMRLFELADESRVPQLTSDSEVFAASHQGVAFASLGGSGDSRLIEVFLLTASDGNKTATFGFAAFQVSSTNITHRPRQTKAYSLLTIFVPTLVSLRGARPQPPGPKALFKILRYFISGR